MHISIYIFLPDRPGSHDSLPSTGDSTTGPSGEPEEPGEPMDDDADGELDEEAPESELEEDDPVVDDIKE